MPGEETEKFTNDLRVYDIPEDSLVRIPEGPLSLSSLRPDFIYKNMIGIQMNMTEG